jgi:hypothetical protein
MLHTALLLAAVAVSQSEIQSKYDRFRDTTFYRRTLGVLDNGKEYRALSISASHKGEERKRFKDAQFVTITIYRHGPRWRYLDDHDVVIMQGRKRFKTQTLYDHKIDEEDHTCKEFMGVRVEIAELRSGMANDEEWDVKTGIDQPFPIGPVTRRKIKEYLDYIQASTSGTGDDKKKVASPKQAVSAGEIEVKYDKFDDETSYFNPIDHQYEGKEYRNLSLHANHKGEKRRRFDDSETITLLVTRRGDGWLYLDDHDVIVMEGRNRFVIETDYDNKIDSKDHKCYEYVHILMPISEARKRLASRRDWEIKIGTEQPFSLDEATRKKIAAFLDYLQEPSLKE